MIFRSTHFHLKKSLIVALIFFLVSGSLQAEAYFSDDVTKNQIIFLPLINNNYSTKEKMILGVYVQGSLFSQNTYNNEVKLIDSWSLVGNSIIGTFIDFSFPNPNYNVKTQLDLIWENGYTPFINFMSSKTSYQLARGDEDQQIKATAQAFAHYARNGTRFAFIALFPEMNGEWVSYGKDPENFIEAFKRVQNIFYSEKVPAESIRWVFAPNGWSESGLEFENFYPGDNFVDIVAISAYNFGYSTNSQWSNWEKPEDVFGPYLSKLRQMTNKPIFISQTGTTAQYPSKGKYDIGKKNEWLKDTYEYLSNQEQVRAIIYFNLKNDQNIDWPFYPHGISEFIGYKEGVNNGNYIYIPPLEIKDFLFPN